VRKSRPDAKVKEIEQLISRWLVNAKDQDGQRKHRKTEGASASASPSCSALGADRDSQEELFEHSSQDN